MVTDVRARRWLTGAFVVYLGAVAKMTLWPEFASDEQLGTVRAIADWLAGLGLPVTFAGVEAVANVVMFVPFGVLAGLLVPRRRWWAVTAAGCALSVAIETSQRLFLPTRVPTVQDVVLNTLGAAVGVLVLVVGVAVARRARDDASATAPGVEPRARPRSREPFRSVRRRGRP